MTGLPERPGPQPLPVNWGMHYGQAALLGVLRSVMAQAGLRGPVASAKFAVVRLTNDQISGERDGRRRPTADLAPQGTRRGPAAQGLYAFATGAVADALAARDGAGPGQRHAAVRPGRRAHVGPLPRRHAYGA
ncbi:hypothetical protein GCM10010384_09830 [Streptomyces djakartensis]|uniref:Uncharacterized protein n=1 Tax=Streptomyces djakartensis TaxID=68193 RepID=A0ABQ2Z7D0_9ACTN|nr:hypothetical protein GCM10010384_09830 [Streptomyces djakartensis]